MQRSVLFALVLFTASSVCAAAATAQSSSPSDHVYIVSSNDTLTRVAQRLHVSPTNLAARNGLRAPYRLRIGQHLRLPIGVPADVARTLPLAHPHAPASAHVASVRARPETETAPSETHHAGVVRLIRHRDDAEVVTNFSAASPTFGSRMERFFRFRDGSRHLMHPRLLRALASVSDHFGGRGIVVLSGFRPQLRSNTQGRTRHSQGYAVDVRVDGVAVEALQAFCVTLTEMGCGLYPRARFVHIDVRRTAASWVDNALPNTRRAGTHPAASEESVDEVMADAAPVRSRANEER